MNGSAVIPEGKTQGSRLRPTRVSPHPSSRHMPLNFSCGCPKDSYPPLPIGLPIEGGDSVPMAPFWPRHPRTCSWERGAKMPDYSAGGVVLSTWARPISYNPAFGDRFFVLKNLSKKSSCQRPHLPKCPAHVFPMNLGNTPKSRFSSPLKGGRYIGFRVEPWPTIRRVGT